MKREAFFPRNVERSPRATATPIINIIIIIVVIVRVALPSRKDC
jgi:hypothetical protein